MKRLIGVLVLVVGIAGFLVGQEQLAEEQVFRYGSPGSDIATLDPHFATRDYVERPAVEAIFNGLVRFPPGKSISIEDIEPDLAESWESNEEMTIWTFHLRKGVQWHKGYGEFTAEDVEFSIKRVMDPEVGSPWRGDFAGVENIEIIDDYTVCIHLKRPDPFFLLRVVGYNGGYIVCKKAVEELGDKFGLNPIGTGPFVFEKYEPRKKVVLRRNDQYFRGTPILEKVEFLFLPDPTSRELALREGEIDAMMLPSSQKWVTALKEAGFIVDLVGPGNMWHIHFNMTKRPFDDIRVRKALAYAFDRDAVIEYDGPAISSKTYGPVPPGYFGYTPDVEQWALKYDPEKAKELLKEAGYPEGFTFEVHISEAPSYKPYAELTQAMWSKVGVKMELKVVDHPTYHSLIRQDVEPVVFYNASRLPLADIYLRQWFHSKSIVGKPTAITNFSHYGEVDADGDGTIDSIDELIDEASVTTDLERQKGLYAQAQRQILEDVPVISYKRANIPFARRSEVHLPYGTETEEGHVYFANLWPGYILNEKVYIGK